MAQGDSPQSTWGAESRETRMQEQKSTESTSARCGKVVDCEQATGAARLSIATTQEAMREPDLFYRNG